MSEAYFRIFRGSHQIGGCCSEFRLGKRRIVIDFGANLPGTDDPDIDDKKLVQAVFGKKEDIAATDAVLFAHYHGDHVGLKRSVPESVPTYIGRTAKKIMKIIASRVDYRNEKTDASAVPEILMIERMKSYPKGGKTIDFSGISVTPLYIDHSALDSYMFVVEMCGKRILYTGDFRDHGIPGSDRFDRLIQKYVGKIDILITEGTMLSRLKEAKKNPVQTEDDLGREAEKIFAAHHENVVIVSSTNVDSVMEFYHHTPTGMAFLCDAVQAEILQEAISSRNFGNYRYSKNIYVLCPNNYKGYMRNLHDPHFKMADESKYNKKGFVMLVRPNNPRFRELLGKMKDPHITYSMWSGYLKGGKCKDAQLVEFLQGHDDEAHFTQLHTSGHAYVETLAKLIEMTKPEVIIPMHTESADEFAKMPEFAAYKDRVNVLRDGEVYKINMEFDINGFINTEKPEDSICREERQYAALLYTILLKAKNKDMKKHKNGIIVSLLGDKVETIEHVFFEATLMRDYFNALSEEKKTDFNKKLLDFCGVKIPEEKIYPDSLASSSHNWSEEKILSNSLASSTHNELDKLIEEQRARFQFARYMMRAKPDIMVIYTDKNHGRCAKILECKKESDEGKYKDIWGSETIKQEIVQACIMNFLFGKCIEEIPFGTYPPKAKAKDEYENNKDAYDFQKKLANYDYSETIFKGIKNMGVKETDFEPKKNSNAFYIPAKCLIEYAYK